MAEVADANPLEVLELGMSDSQGFEVPAPKKMLETPSTAMSSPVARLDSMLDAAASGPSREVKVLARRIKELESRQQCVEERFVQDRIACPAGPTTAQWSQMHSEMERMRRLFEFVETVLPKESAEAMRFFNARALATSSETQKESAVPVDSRPLGLEVEMERYKAQVDKANKKSHAAMHQEVSNCMLAIKGLQRDVDITRGALLAERPRILPGETPNGRRVPPPGPMSPSASMEGPGGTSNDDPDSGSPGTLASRKLVQEEIDNLREEVKSWLDHLSENLHNSLRHKADKQTLVNNADQSALARRQLVGRAPPIAASEAGPAMFDATKAMSKNWRPSTSPGIKQIRAPGAALCGPGSKSLPKFPASPAEAVRPFGQDTVKALRQR